MFCPSLVISSSLVQLIVDVQRLLQAYWLFYQRFCKNLFKKGVDITYLKAFAYLVILNIIFAYANKTLSFVSYFPLGCYWWQIVTAFQITFLPFVLLYDLLWNDSVTLCFFLCCCHSRIWSFWMESVFSAAPC